MPSFNAHACLNLVNLSPAAVTSQDKKAWLNLFARRAIVEDPVGSRPHTHDKGNPQGPLARFYDTFIHGNKIIFNVERDFVQDGMVLRDLSMTIVMSKKVQVVVPMHLLYELTEQDGELKIQRLAAHWELVPMSRQLMRFGLASLGASIKNAIKMLRHLGIGGMLGFMQARQSIGEAGKEILKQYIASGMVEGVPSSAHITKQLSAGFVSSASIEFEQAGARVAAVVLGNFDRDSGVLLGTRTVIGEASTD